MRLGSKHSVQTRVKIKAKALGRKLSSTHKAKFTFKGRAHTDEAKRKIGDGNRKPKSEEGRQNIAQMLRQRKYPNRKRGYTLTEEQRLKISISGKGKKKSKETRAKMSVALKLRPRSPTTMEKLRAGQKRWWENLSVEERQKRMRNLNRQANKQIGPRASSFQPNNLERAVQQYLDKHFPNEWKFNQGDFVIAGFVPDFINVNGQKAVIEVFGDYWHRGENPKRKISIYKKVGFDCVVIWEHEFYHNPDRLNELLQ